jgi:DNA-binding PadR family transcriptional regulator
MALSDNALHGLGIADHVEEASEGVIVLGPGTLYRSLDEMQEAGLIEKARAPEPDPDPRRKYYRITPRGRGVLSTEMERLARLVEHAKARKVIRGRA